MQPLFRRNLSWRPQLSNVCFPFINYFERTRLTSWLKRYWFTYVDNPDSELIANYLSRNKPALENMLAEVRSQSADDLVDGITSTEERRYSYNHYYGTRFHSFCLI